MIGRIFVVWLVVSLALPVSAREFTAPEAPESAEFLMPEDPENVSDALWEFIGNLIIRIHPEASKAFQSGIQILAVTGILAILRLFSGNAGKMVEMLGSIWVALMLFSGTGTLFSLATQTVRELADYGKLLFPVMTAAMAAQGSVTQASSLYAGTMILDTLLSSILSGVLIPLMSLFLAFSLVNHTVGDEMLKKLAEMIHTFAGWLLKTMLMVFTTFMSITGVVSGTTDAAALKTAKVTISSVVPVVGGILSDASEAVLVSMRTMKNAVGIYGIFVILSVTAGPFLKIWIPYLMMKVTAVLCSMFNVKKITGLLEDFCAAMGILFAMTGTAGILLLISIVCFMKGI